jgi:hypothetical protein
LERAADAVADAIAEAMDILGAVSAAEREREQAAEAAEASSVEALLRRADMQDRLAGIAAGMAAEARQLARDAGAGL